MKIKKVSKILLIYLVTVGSAFYVYCVDLIIINGDEFPGHKIGKNIFVTCGRSWIPIPPNAKIITNPPYLRKCQCKPSKFVSIKISKGYVEVWNKKNNTIIVRIANNSKVKFFIPKKLMNSLKHNNKKFHKGDKIKIHSMKNRKVLFMKLLQQKK